MLVQSRCRSRNLKSGWRAFSSCRCGDIHPQRFHDVRKGEIGNAILWKCKFSCLKFDPAWILVSSRMIQTLFGTNQLYPRQMTCTVVYLMREWAVIKMMWKLEKQTEQTIESSKISWMQNRAETVSWIFCHRHQTQKWNCIVLETP